MSGPARRLDIGANHDPRHAGRVVLQHPPTVGLGARYMASDDSLLFRSPLKMGRPLSTVAEEIGHAAHIGSSGSVSGPFLSRPKRPWAGV